MGGAIAEGNVTPAAEFNIWADPEAAWRVFHSGLAVTMIGLDVTHKALMTDAHAERLRAAGRGRAASSPSCYDFFVRYHRRTYGFEGSPIHDAVAVAQVLRPGIVETLHRHVEVDCESRALPRAARSSTSGTGPGRSRTRRRRRHRRGRLPRASLRADRLAA